MSSLTPQVCAQGEREDLKEGSAFVDKQGTGTAWQQQCGPVGSDDGSEG